MRETKEARERALRQVRSIPTDPDEMRALIAQAEAAGRVTRLPPGFAFGVSPSDAVMRFSRHERRLAAVMRG